MRPPSSGNAGPRRRGGACPARGPAPTPVPAVGAAICRPGTRDIVGPGAVGTGIARPRTQETPHPSAALRETAAATFPSRGRQGCRGGYQPPADTGKGRSGRRRDGHCPSADTGDTSSGRRARRAFWDFLKPFPRLIRQGSRSPKSIRRRRGNWRSGSLRRCFSGWWSRRRSGRRCRRCCSGSWTGCSGITDPDGGRGTARAPGISGGEEQRRRPRKKVPGRRVVLPKKVGARPGVVVYNQREEMQPAKRVSQTQKKESEDR